MYIEVLHDAQGNIAACWCADTLPEKNNEPLFVAEGGLPAGHEQARLNIDTLTAMEIDAACGQKAVIDAATGLPVIINVSRSDYIISNYYVDFTTELEAHGLKFRGMRRK